MAEDNTIYMKEKDNYPRDKKSYGELVAKVYFSGKPETAKEARLKYTKPLVKKVEGPFNEKNEIVSELQIGKSYIYKVTEHEESILSLIKNVWWAKQLDDGKIVDLKYEKDKNPYLDEEGIVCFKYEVRKCEKVRIYAYVSEPNKEQSVVSDVIKSGKAILIAFPDQNPKIPENQNLARWFERNFDDGDGEVEGAGHAGIVIINGKGETKYFDFGRYTKISLGRRPKDMGIVRSSKSFSSTGKNGLRVYNWDSNLTEEENVKKILKQIHDKNIFKNYGITIGALAEKLDYDKMLNYATSLEKKGYHPFGGYTSSTDIENPSYCAKFARGVAKAGGFDWNWYVFSGKQNVENVSESFNNKIIIIK